MMASLSATSEPYIDIFDLPIEMRQLAFGPVLPEWPVSTSANPFRCKRLSGEMPVEILSKCGWNKAEAGRRVNLSRTTIWKYMRNWHIPLYEP